VTEAEARKAFGQPVPTSRDRMLEQLFEEDRQDELACPDIQLDRHRAYAWGLEDAYAC